MPKTDVKLSIDEVAKPTTGESVRETVDSIVIAFVLAFLFRTFEAEAFVIPTGSMALTLMGDHKDLTCVKCGYPYRAGASDESSSNNPNHQAQVGNNAAAWAHGHTVTSAACPNCRYRMNFDDDERVQRRAEPDVPMPPSFKGDRILVTKYSYDFADPERWDVAVFKNPSQAKINYIKRIAGLPNEEVLIYRGDVYVRTDGDQPFRMARKPHDKAEAMAQIVYDHDYVLPLMHERGWPQRWTAPQPEGAAAAAWTNSADQKSFRTDGGDAEAWLRYQHYVPSAVDWAVLAKQPLDPERRANLKPQLITDFCQYNSEWIRNGQNASYSYLGLHWVGDIAVECELEFGARRNDEAEAVLEIVEGGKAYQCRIRAASGDVTLSIDGLEKFRPTARGAFAGNGPRTVRFANVDDRLLVWIDGKPVTTFDASTAFQTVEQLEAVYDGREVAVPFGGENGMPALNNLVPTRQDMASPAGVAAKGCALNVAHLRVLRDVYYIADAANSGNQMSGFAAVRDYRDDVLGRFEQERARRSLRPDLARGPDWEERRWAAFMSDIDTWPERFLEASYVSFQMGEDQFFVLGDNSPKSLDSRLWDPDETFVRRELLIGKALFVYWPHALEKIPGTNISFPIFPNFARMRMIR